MGVISLVLLALVVSGILLLSRVNTVYSAKISTPGDIILGGLFPVHKQGSKENVCGKFNEIPGFQYMEAMLYALEKINNRTDILPGIKLGTIIYDTCRSPTITADKTKEFIKLTLSSTAINGSELAGVIGPLTSGNSIIVANFLRVFEIPQISYASLSVELSNKRYYNYFFRTVPPDSYYAEGLAELLKTLGWTYVSIIYSTGTYPETGTQEVIKALSKRDICIAKKHRLPRFPKEEDFDEAIMKAASVAEANVVVFVTIQRDSRELLMAKERQPLAKRLSFIGSVAWSNRDDITKGLGDVADGTITFGHQEGTIKEFEKYFRSFNMSNYMFSYKEWFEEFWEKQFNCSLKNVTPITCHNKNYTKQCSGKESLLNHRMEIAPVRVVMNAVNAMAYALHNMHKNLCPNTSKLCDKMKPLPRTLLQKFIKNVTFPDSSFNWSIRFDLNNEVEGNYTVLNFRKSNYTVSGNHAYIPVGTWTSKLERNGQISGKLRVNFSDIRWTGGNTAVPSSVCSSECDERSIKRTRDGSAQQCCWDCITCNKYDVILNNTCRTCAEGYVPGSKNSPSCLKLNLKYINMDTPLAVFLVFLSCVGILANLVTCAVFFINRRHRLIVASNRKMCSFIFVGIFLIFMLPMTFLAKPAPGLCYAQRILMSLSFVICYAALLVKVRAMYWIFRKESKMRPKSQMLQVPRNPQIPRNQIPRKEKWKPSFLSSRTQLVLTACFITIQGLLCIVILTRNKPTLQEKFYPESDELFLECSVRPSVFVAYLACSIVLISTCTVYAFLARNIPLNYRETLHIGITIYVSNVVWVVFLACFSNITHSFTRIYLISGSSVLIGWITLGGLFAPKVYQLNTKQVFDKNSLMKWSSSSLQKTDSAEKTVELDSCKMPGLCPQEVDVAKETNDEESSRSSQESSHL